MVFEASVGVEPREAGDRGERCAQADVPGSSDPSGQSQKSSFTRAIERWIDGDERQVKVSAWL